jgi:hypothetical protein
MKRDYAAEIEEKKKRICHIPFNPGLTKLLQLTTCADRVEKESEELGYFLVAAVAALESFFRSQIAELIDSGDTRYLTNIPANQIRSRIDGPLLLALHGRRISLGELVAHLVTLSNLDTLNRSMTDLLGTDFLEMVKDARDPWDHRERGENAPPVLERADEVFGDVARTFELRHRICHEVIVGEPVRLDELKRLCRSSYSFAVASYYAIAHHFNPGTPLTLEEALRAASEKAESLAEQIQAVEKSIVRHLPPVALEAFSRAQESWRHYVTREAEFAASQEVNGNRCALVEKHVTADRYRKRLEELSPFATGLEESSGSSRARE